MDSWHGYSRVCYASGGLVPYKHCAALSSVGKKVELQQQRTQHIVLVRCNPEL
jgi:hypothetical protein